MDEKEVWDFLIIGGGAAGLTAAQYGARAGLKTAVIETASAGGQALLINDLENYPGLFPTVSGFDFSSAMEKQAKAFGAAFYSANVVSIDKKNGVFYVSAENETFLSKTLLLATGASHKKLDIPGEAELAGRGVSYCASCDGPFFRNKVVTVIGGGDAACDEARYLSTIASKVYLVHRRGELRAQAGVAQKVVENPKITLMLNQSPVRINGNGRVESVLLKNTLTGEETEHKTDAVFIFVGMIPQTSLVEFIKKDSAGYVVTDENMQTSIPGLFCAGDVRSKPFRQVVTAAADGAYAAYGAENYIRNMG